MSDMACFFATILERDKMTDTPMRERLAEGLQSDLSEAGMSVTLSECLVFIDNRLTELESPSEGMKRQMFLTKYMDKGPVVMWRAMIQHIKDGGQ